MMAPESIHQTIAAEILNSLMKSSSRLNFLPTFGENAITTQRVDTFIAACFRSAQDERHLAQFYPRHLANRRTLQQLLMPSLSRHRAWVLERKADGKMIGFLVYGEFADGQPNSGAVFIGYPFVRCGYAKEALTHLGYFLHSQGINDLNAYCLNGDQATIRTLERAGFGRAEYAGDQLSRRGEVRFNLRTQPNPNPKVESYKYAESVQHTEDSGLSGSVAPVFEELKDPEGLREAEALLAELLAWSDRCHQWQALERLRTHDVVFIPGTRLDFEPLLRLTDRVRVFVFCCQDDHAPETTPLELGLPNNVILTPDLLEESCLDRLVARGEPAANWATKYNRQTPAGIRHIQVVSFRGDPISVYQRLFPNDARRPWGLCLKHVSSREGEWRQLLEDPTSAKPLHLLAPNGLVLLDWIHRYRVYPTWNNTALFQSIVMEPPLLPGLEHAGVRIDRGPLQPGAMQAGAAAHLTLDQFQDYDWLNVGRIFLDSADEQLVQALQGIHDGIVALPISGLPLEKAIESVLEALDGDRAFTHFHTAGFGHEDEAALIANAWLASGIQAELVLHPRGEAEADALQGYECRSL